MSSAVVSPVAFQVVKYMGVASLAVLIFDYLLTVQSEVKFIWRSRWSIGKVLFLFSRYLAFFDVPLSLYHAMAPRIPPSQCLPIYRTTSWSGAIGIGVAEAILILRTYALWDRSKKVLYALLSLYIVVCISVIVVIELSLRSLQYGSLPTPNVTGCHPTYSSNIVFADFVLLMLLETVILALTLYRGVTKYRHARGLLVVTLYRDGILYFIYLFLISVGNIIVIAALPTDFVDLLDTFQRVMHSLLSTRILLHLHEASRADNIRPLSGLESYRSSHRGKSSLGASILQFSKFNISNVRHFPRESERI